MTENEILIIIYICPVIVFVSSIIINLFDKEFPFNMPLYKRILRGLFFGIMFGLPFVSLIIMIILLAGIILSPIFALIEYLEIE